MKMLSEITLDFTPLYWIIEEILTNNKKNQRFGTRYLYNIQGKIKLISNYNGYIHNKSIVFNMNYKLLRVRIKHFAFSKEAFAVRTAMLFIISKTFTTEHIFPDFFLLRNGQLTLCFIHYHSIFFNNKKNNVYLIKIFLNSEIYQNSFFIVNF